MSAETERHQRMGWGFFQGSFKVAGIFVRRSLLLLLRFVIPFVSLSSLALPLTNTCHRPPADRSAKAARCSGRWRESSEGQDSGGEDWQKNLILMQGADALRKWDEGGRLSGTVPRLSIHLFFKRERERSFRATHGGGGQ